MQRKDKNFEKLMETLIQLEDISTPGDIQNRLKEYLHLLKNAQAQLNFPDLLALTKNYHALLAKNHSATLLKDFVLNDGFSPLESIQLLSIKDQNDQTLLMNIFKEINDDPKKLLKKLENLQKQAPDAFSELMKIKDRDGKTATQNMGYEFLLYLFVESESLFSSDDLIDMVRDAKSFVNFIENDLALMGEQRTSFFKRVYDPEASLGKILRKREFTDSEVTPILRVAAISYFTNQYNSILGWWKKQSTWIEAKQNAILQTREFYRNKNPSFRELYWFVCQLRHQIAVDSASKEESLDNIDSDAVDFFGRSRVATLHQPLEPWIEKSASLVYSGHPAPFTAILTSNVYSNFVPALLALTKEQIQDKASQKLSTKYQNTTLSTVELESDNSLTIFHTHIKDLPKAMEIGSGIYDQFRDEKGKEPSLELQTLKKLLWLNGQAMFCCRGSATISEIIFEALKAEHNLNFDYTGHQIPIDLVAIFSSTPEIFISKLREATEKDKMIEELFSYLLTLEKEPNPQAQLFRESQPTYTTLDKISAAGKIMLLLMEKPSITLSDREMRALTDPKIRVIFDKYSKLQFLSHVEGLKEGNKYLP